MTIREVITKMTTIVGKADPNFEDTVEQFCSDLDVCRADLIATANRLSLPSMGKPTVNFSADYINMFLNKFEKVDAMIGRLTSNASTPTKCAVSEEEFKGLDLSDIGVDNIPQPDSTLNLWTNKGGGSVVPEVCAYTFRMNAYKLNGVTTCFDDEFGSIIEEPFSECGLKMEDRFGDIFSLCMEPATSTVMRLIAIHKKKSYYTAPEIEVIGGLKSSENPSTYLESITDTDPTSPSHGVDCKLMSRTIVDVSIAYPAPEVLTLAASPEPVVPPMVTAPEPADYLRVRRVFISYANRGQTILDFNRMLVGNFGKEASSGGMDNLLKSPLIRRNDATALMAECLSNRIVNEARELGDAEMLVDNLVNSRQLEMLASLFAVKFALLKILYGHVRRTK